MNRASADNERHALARYLREIRAFPLLSREDERCLLRRIERGDAEAATRLVECNLSFVVKVATEYRSLGVPFEDLLNEGNLGLIEAARRFDASKGTKFITYAIWWIRKTILGAITDRSLVVRVPCHRRKKIYEVKKAEDTLIHELGRAPTREEIARHLSVGVAQVDSLRSLPLTHTSLDQGVGEDNAAPLLEFLADDDESVEQRLLGEEAQLRIARAFRGLTFREQTVLAWRLGLGGSPPQTLKQVGERLAISRERVRQIENLAKRRLLRLFSTDTRSSS